MNKFGELFFPEAKLHRTWENFKPYEYEKASIQMSHLISHQRIHIGKKSYSCKKCVKAYSHKSNITDHKKIHMGEKTFECNECGKNFSQKQYLTKHHIAHFGEKSCKCKECGKSFLSIRKKISLPIRKFILKRNRLDVMTVTKF